MDYDRIEEFLLEISESTEYKKIAYLIHNIRKLYLDYMTNMRMTNYAIPPYLMSFGEYVESKFEESGIDAKNLLDYMLDNDDSKWVRFYYYSVICSETVAGGFAQCEDSFFIHLLIGYVLDNFRDTQVDIQKIVEDEQFMYETNQYCLTVVNGVEFKRDSFIYDGKAYLYSLLTNTNVINFTDEMPGFAKIISEEVHSGNILMRLDERLAVPRDQMISYSTLNFEKFRGPQFHFNNSNLEHVKTITVHIDSESADKLLMVIKKDFDTNLGEDFMHIEIETLPYVGTNATSHRITTFLHGMYYPKSDVFTHIDCAKNQYRGEDYLKKYEESTPEVKVDFYAEKQLHYKIWCIENGRYSRDIWYKLMQVSLSEKYRRLLDEILE